MDWLIVSDMGVLIHCSEYVQDLVRSVDDHRKIELYVPNGL